MSRRRLIASLVLIAAALCWPAACGGGGDRIAPATEQLGRQPGQLLAGNLDGCAEDFDSNRDYFPDKLTVDYAKGFTVSYRRNYKVVRTVINALDRQIPQTSSTLVLVQCGTPAPQLTGELAGANVFQIPARTVALTNPGEVAMIRALGLSSRLVAVDTDSIYPDVAAGQATGKIQKIGYSARANIEAVLNINPELFVILSWVGTQQAKVEEARRVGLPVAPSHAWIEPTPLGHAEWVKYLALFFNKEREAMTFFGGVAGDYEKLAARAAASENKPTAFFASALADGTWTVDRNGKGARLLEDAGARNVLGDAGATYPVQMSDERVIDLAAHAEYWVMDDHADTSDQRKLAALLKSVAKGQVYDPFRVIEEFGAPDYYGTGVSRPDLVLKDLVSIFHPELLPGHELHLLRQHPLDYQPTKH